MGLIFFNQSFIGKAIITVVADDDVIKHSDLHNSTGKNQISGYLPVATRRLGIPRRVIMDKDQAGGFIF
jgi:hypothetical protein